MKIPPGNYGAVWISEAIDLSKPMKYPMLGKLLMRMSTKKRRQNGYKNAATRMATKFSKGVS